MQSDLDLRVAAIRRGIETAGTELEPAAAERANRDLDEVLARFRTTGDHTVVALVGGTGSGKSSLFNAITRSTFADSGFIRPSTRQTSACAWGSRADELMGFLGVRPSRRMFRDTLLEREDLKAIDGLVLLDLPDHDSVEEHHSAQVNRLLPVVDVLIWVVDPQKYADHILHENYLRALRSRADAMVVVLNQVDTLDDRGLDIVDGDVRRLLAADGLGEVPVLHTCALTGEGIGAVHSLLRAAVGEESTAHRTARAGIAAVATELLTHVGAGEATTDAAVVDLTADELMRANGIGAVTRSIEEATSRWVGGALAAPQPPARATMAAIGSTWAGRVKQGLPRLWSRAVDASLPSVESLLRSTADAVASVPLPEVRVPKAEAFGWAAVAGALAAVTLVVAGILQGWPVAWVIGPAIVLVGVAGMLLGAARGTRTAVGAAWAAAYERDVRAALAATVDAELAAPAAVLLERHRAVRGAFEEARLSTAAGSDAPSTGAHAG